jgi:tetratricopeptide (TPR) repeat protein
MYARAAALLIAATLYGQPLQIAPRRDIQPPQINLSNLLGSLQPEPVRSILLLHSGRSLSKARAQELEADLRSTPDDTDARLNLIGYYSWNGNSPADSLRLREHVLWMVEHHPENPATGEPGLIDLPDDPDGSARILELWKRNIQLYGNNSAVLQNAERYFFGQDPAEADRIIHILSAREPANNQWPQELARLYRLCGVPGSERASAADAAADAYNRVLELTRSREARATLAGDMAEAEFKVGNFDGAAALARIQLGTTDPAAGQRGNTILGRVALRDGDIEQSKHYLIESSKPSALRRASLYAPSMTLAKELLQQGEKDAVIEYLENCLALWPDGRSALQSWITDIRNGKIPNFGTLGY